MFMVFSFRIQQDMKEPWPQSRRLRTLHVNPVARVGGLIAGIDYAMCPAGLRKSRAGRKPNIATRTTVQKCIDACSMRVTHESHRHFRTWKCSLQVGLSLIHISEPTRLGMISYAVFCLK